MAMEEYPGEAIIAMKAKDQRQHLSPSRGEAMEEEAPGGVPEPPTGWGPMPRRVGRPHPHGRLGTLLAQLFYPMALFWSKNKLGQVSGQLESVWFSFSAIL